MKFNSITVLHKTIHQGGGQQSYPDMRKGKICNHNKSQEWILKHLKQIGPGTANVN